MSMKFSLYFATLIIFGFIDTSMGQTFTEHVRNQYVTLHAGNLTTTVCNNHHMCNSTDKQSNMHSRKGCQCDSACEYFNDCCYDHIISHNLQKEFEEMQNVFDDHLIMLNDWECLDLDQASYWVVSRCDTGISGIVAERCHYPVCNDTLSSVPVTDTNGITYRNVYCAVCHGVDVSDLTAWKVEASCDSAMEQLLADSNHSAPGMDTICSKCKISILVPQLLIENPKASRSCVSNIVSTCQKTGFTVQDSGVQATCDSYTALIDFNGTTYKNPHCFTCNHANISWQNQTLQCNSGDIPQLTDGKKSMTQTTNKTKKASSDTNRRAKYPQGPRTHKPSVNGVPLSIILDFGSGDSSSLRIYNERKIIKETLVSCPSRHVYAEHSGRGECVALSCPVGTKYINGACIPYLTSKIPDTDDTRWCESNTSGGNITLTATVTSPFSSCKNQTFIALTSECLLHKMHLSETIRSCNQLQRDISEILYDIDNKTLRDIQHSFPQKTLATGHLDNTTKDSLCGVSKLTLTQTCLDQSDLQSCSSEWLSISDITIRQLNGTKYIYHNASKTWHESNNLISRDIYTLTSSGVDKRTQLKLCNALPLFECPLLTLNSSLFALSEDGSETLTYLPGSRQFGAREYTVTADGHIKVCNFLEQWSLKNETGYEAFFTYSKIQTLVSMVGTLISMVAAAATFITFSVFSSLRNTTSRLIMNLIVALFSGQLLLLVSGYASNDETLCFGVAIASHYAWLVVFTSMNALAFDLNRTFGNSENLQSIGNNKRSTGMYILYSWGAPLMVIAPSVFIHHCQCTPRVELRYGDNGVCWIGDGIANLVMFATPAATLLLVNLLLYAQTVAGIWATKRATSTVYKDGAAMKRIIKELGIYVKLSTLMGFTWIFGYVASFTGIEVIWYSFIILNSLQGFFIFMSFTCNGRVAALWKRTLTNRSQSIQLNSRFGNNRSRRTSNMSNNTSKVTTLSYSSSKMAYADVVNQLDAYQKR